MAVNKAEAAKKTRALVSIVNKALKADVLTVASDPRLVVRYLRTGVVPFDQLLGGGLPYGRFVEVFGDYSTLKSYVGLSAIANCQAEGGMAAIIDTERAFDPLWAESVGVDLDSLILWPPKEYTGPVNGEAAIDAAEALIRGRVDLIVFDSVAAALPRAEEETQLSGDKNIQPARLAQLMSTACRKLTTANQTTAVLWINQTRTNVGVMFGSNESVPGGKALGFYSSMRVAMRKSGKETQEVEVFKVENGKIVKSKVKQTIGTRIRMTLEKSKLNTPHRDEYFIFDHREGKVDTWWYLATKALELGVIFQGNGWWWKSQRGNPTKMRLSDFRGAVDEEELLSLMAARTQTPLVSPGKSLPAVSKAASPSAKSSSAGARKSTRTRAQAGSKTTVRIRKTSTK
ncbi:hypothetical protein [Streptomyces sp. NPDC006477]|uniref:hypothetical protein n=1 Tax=Streptomyces sp. NPDC006477 TaxID=3364747 RepID=UPI0036B60F74